MDKSGIVDLDHVALRVTDLEESLSFYGELLGMEIRDRDRYENGEIPFVGLVSGGRQLHLVPIPESAFGEEDPPLGGEHVCFLLRSDTTDTKAELEDLLADIEAAGYRVEAGEPAKRYGAYGRDWAGYVRDPDGRRVELKLH